MCPEDGIKLVQNMTLLLNAVAIITAVSEYRIWFEQVFD